MTLRLRRCFVSQPKSLSSLLVDQNSGTSSPILRNSPFRIFIASFSGTGETLLPRYIPSAGLSSEWCDRFIINVVVDPPQNKRDDSPACTPDGVSGNYRLPCAPPYVRGIAEAIVDGRTIAEADEAGIRRSPSSTDRGGIVPTPTPRQNLTA